MCYHTSGGHAVAYAKRDFPSCDRQVAKQRALATSTATWLPGWPAQVGSSSEAPTFHREIRSRKYLETSDKFASQMSSRAPSSTFHPGEAAPFLQLPQAWQLLPTAGGFPMITLGPPDQRSKQHLMHAPAPALAQYQPLCLSLAATPRSTGSAATERRCSIPARAAWHRVRHRVPG